MIIWNHVAKRLGYENEKAMWVDLYVEKNLSLSQLGIQFDVSSTTIRFAIARCGIEVRPRGGPNHTGPDSRWPADETLIELFKTEGCIPLAKRLGFHPTAVYKRIRRLLGDPKYT